MRISAILLATAIVCPTLAKSQAPSNPSPSPNVYQPSMSAVVAVHPTPAPALLLAPSEEGRVSAAREFSSRAPGGALMIMGSAALLAGLLTDGSGSTALILGGIGVGAYGVYLYTR